MVVKKVFFKKFRKKRKWDYKNIFKFKLSMLNFIDLLNMRFFVFNKFLLKKYLYTYNGLYLSSWKSVNKFKFILNRSKRRTKEKFSILHFVFGPQQIHFVLHSDNIKKQETHATVGALLRLKLNIENNDGSYKHVGLQEDALRDIEKRRTKKWISFFKDEYKRNSFRNIFDKNKLFSARKKERKLERKKNLEKNVKLTLQKKKFVDETVLYNKRRNPKTEPLLFKRNRRNSGTWIWFFRMIVLFLKKKWVRPQKKIILNIHGYKKIYGFAITYLIRILKKFDIILFFFNLSLNFNKEKIKPITTIKRRRRKRILKKNGVFSTLYRMRF